MFSRGRHTTIFIVSMFMLLLLKDLLAKLIITCTLKDKLAMWLCLLTLNVHLVPNTQQAEQAGFTRAKNHKTCQSIFPEN
jgi:hypothetical protein